MIRFFSQKDSKRKKELAIAEQQWQEACLVLESKFDLVIEYYTLYLKVFLKVQHGDNMHEISKKIYEERYNLRVDEYNKYLKDELKVMEAEYLRKFSSSEVEHFMTYPKCVFSDEKFWCEKTAEIKENWSKETKFKRKHASTKTEKERAKVIDWFSYVEITDITDKHKMSIANQIDLSDIEPKSRNQWEVLGRGAFGIVYKCYNYGAIAVKVLETSRTKRKREHLFEDFEKEMQVLQSLSHDCIVKYRGYIKTRDFFGLVMEYCEGDTLFNFIYKQDNRKPSSSSDADENILTELENVCIRDLDNQAIFSICIAIANGLAYLHSLSIIHRDLKSQNVFLKFKPDTPYANCEVKIGDFGLASFKRLSSKSANKNNGHTSEKDRPKTVGSILWMAPELLTIKTGQETNPYTIYSDLYAYGMILWEIFAQELPFKKHHRRGDALQYLRVVVGSKLG